MRTVRGTLIGGLICAALLMLATACGGGSDDTATTGASPSGPQKGGTLVMAFSYEPSSLDPAVSWDVLPWQIQQTIFDNLYRYKMKPGVEGTELEPSIAEAMPEITNGGKTYLIRLKKGVKFAPPVDREVTAEDFKYSFERMMKLPLAPGTYFYTGIVGAADFQAGKADTVAGYKVVDPYTIQIELTQPDASFLYILSMQFTDVVAKEWVKKWGEKEIARHPLGSGPFTLESWTTGREIVLKRNPNYRAPEEVWLDTIEYQLSVPQATAFLKIQRDEVDVLGLGIPPADIARVKADPQLKDSVYSQPLIGLSCLAMDVNAKPFDNVKVRQAISWAVNRDKLIKVMGGGPAPLYQTIPAGCPGHVEGKQYYGYDPEKAKALLAEAGYPQGFETTLYSSNVDPVPKIMQSVQYDLQAIGIKAAVRTMAGPTFYGSATTPGKLAFHMWGWFMDFPDPSDFIMPLYSKAYIGEGGSNTSGWSDPRVEALLAEAQTMYDQPEARLAKFGEMQGIIMEAAPTVILYQENLTTMRAEDVGGFYLHQVYNFQPQAYWKN